MKRIYLLTIIAQIFCLSSFGQSAKTDSISRKLVNRGYYTQWVGQPPVHIDGTEIDGFTDLDRRILFSHNSVFEEIVFKDWFQVQFPDTCIKTTRKEPITTLFSGKWEIKGDTIHLKYSTKYIYPELEFSNCFYLSRYKIFKCSTPPLSSCKFSIDRYFTLKNEELCEVADNAECYR